MVAWLEANAPSREQLSVPRLSSAHLPDFARETGLALRVTTPYEPAQKAIAPILEDQERVHHACEVETSMMMVVAPDTVKHDRLPEAYGMLNGDPRKAYPASRYLPFKDNLTGTGVIGDARRANASKGEKLLKVCAEGLAATLKNKEMWG